MTTQQVLEKLPDLSGSAAKLLIHRVLTHGDSRTNREIMAQTGIRKQDTLIQARRELRLSGLWDIPENGVPFTGGIPGNGVPITGYIPDYREYPQETVPENREPRITARLDAQVIHGDEESLRQRSMAADLMEVGGDWQNRVSPNSLRRTAQIAVLQAAWTEHFQQDLSIGQAKRLLQLSGDSAETVYDQVEIVAGMPKKVNFPFRYIEAILARPQDQRVVRAAEPQVRSAAIGKPEEPQDYMMNQPSERTRQMEEKMRRLGLLKRDEDDD